VLGNLLLRVFHETSGNPRVATRGGSPLLGEVAQ
jgi:hypothetical protein